LKTISFDVDDPYETPVDPSMTLQRAYMTLKQCKSDLQARMTPQVKENLDDPYVTLVDANVQGCLTSLVACVQVCNPTMQEFDDLRFISESSVMYSSVSVLILQPT